MKIKICIEPSGYSNNTTLYFIGGNYVNGWGCVKRILTIFNSDKFHTIDVCGCQRFTKRIGKIWRLKNENLFNY